MSSYETHYMFSQIISADLQSYKFPSSFSQRGQRVYLLELLKKMSDNARVNQRAKSIFTQKIYDLFSSNATCAYFYRTICLWNSASARSDRFDDPVPSYRYASYYKILSETENHYYSLIYNYCSGCE